MVYWQAVHVTHNRFFPRLFSIIASSTLSTNIVSCSVRAHGLDQTAIADSCTNVTKALLVAYQLEVSAWEVVPHESLITAVNQLSTCNIQQHLVISVQN